MADPDWTQLTHALGRADDLPRLLANLSPDPNASIWGDIWDRVYHQGNTYPASPHILPHLLRAARSWTPASRVMPLALASSVVASPEFPIDGFVATVADLAQVARESVEAAEVTRCDRVYLMSAALTLDGDRVWGPAWEQLHDEVFSGICLACDADLYVTIGELGCYTTENFNQTPEARREAIIPAEAEALTGTAAWAYGVALRVGDRELGQRILCVFGATVCPDCHSRISVSEAIERFQTGA